MGQHHGEVQVDVMDRKAGSLPGSSRVQYVESRANGTKALSETHSEEFLKTNPADSIMENGSRSPRLCLSS